MNQPAIAAVQSAPNLDPWLAKTATRKDRTYEEMFGPDFVKGKPEAFRNARFAGVEPGPNTPSHTNYVFRSEHVTDTLLWLAGVIERNLWIAGPTRSGKSSFVNEMAARTGWEVFEWSASKDKRDYDVVGGIELTANGSEFIPGALIQAMTAPAGIFLVNEGDQAPEAFWTALHDLLDKRQIYVPALKRVVVASDHFRIAVTANSGGLGDGSKLYRGVQRMNIATLLRFAHLRVDYMSEAEEIVWLQREVPRLDPIAATVIVRTATEMRQAFVGALTGNGTTASSDKLEVVLGLAQCKNWAIRMLAYEKASWVKAAQLDPMEEALMRTVLNICNDPTNQHQVVAVKQMLKSVRAKAAAGATKKTP